jgi:hypothetical protein
VADDRLARWAADRAPEVRAQAEDEAVAEVRAILRDALVRAALGDRERPAREPPGRKPAPERPAPARTGHGQWLYAIMRGGAGIDTAALTGVRDTPVQTVKEQELIALVSPVPLSEFGEEQLKESLNDLPWLEDVARAHQRVVDAAFQHGPVVPLRLCTIYESDERVRELLVRDGKRFHELLDAVDGKEEWSVKLFADAAALREEAGRRGGEPARAEAALGAGSAYLARRHSDRAVAEAADRLAGELVEEVHARLQDWAADAVVGRPQNPELSGHSGQMLLNGAYLVERERADRFAELVSELRERHAALGVRLEMSGPWAPYNFIPTEP